MVSSVSSSTTASSASDQMKLDTGFSKDDFLNLFVTQLQYQDPLEPLDPKDMIEQLAMLTQVEQTYNLNATLEKMQQDSALSSSVSFIGKQVQVTGSDVSFDGSTLSPMQFDLGSDSASTDISILDSSGTVVRTISAGGLASGSNTVYWDGRDSNGNAVSAGTYSYAVTASDKSGASVGVTTYSLLKIDGVKVVDGSPVFTSGTSEYDLEDFISIKGG